MTSGLLEPRSSIENSRILSRSAGNTNAIGWDNDFSGRFSNQDVKSGYVNFSPRHGEQSQTSIDVFLAALDRKRDEGAVVNTGIRRESLILSNRQLLERISDSATASHERLRLVCRIELIRFEDADRDKLLDTLWRYIQENRDSSDRDELVAVGSAIRKYIANISMDKMGRLSDLLESGHRAPLPLLLELEVAKMIYHNFEVFPPKQPNPHPELATKLWEMAKVYMNPQVILREDYGTVAALAIAAIIAMQSEYATEAWRAAMAIPHRWFGMLVRGDIDELHEYWVAKDVNAANWLEGLRTELTGTTA